MTTASKTTEARARAQTEKQIDWNKSHAHVKEKGCHIALFDDGWAISFMYSEKVWRRGFQTVGGARRAITAARKRLNSAAIAAAEGRAA